VGGVALRHHHHAAGVLVEAVDDAGAQLAADAGQIGAVGEQGVDQGAARVSGRRMDDQAGRLVDDDQVRILVEDGQRDRLGGELDRRRRTQPDLDPVAVAELGARLVDGGAVQADVPLLDQPLDLGAGQLRVAAGEEGVEARPHLLVAGARRGGVELELLDAAARVGRAHQILDFTCPLDFTRTSTIARS
jgi:hypothetical protein